MSSDRQVSGKPQPEPTPAQQAETLEQVTREFIDYYTGDTQARPAATRPRYELSAEDESAIAMLNVTIETPLPQRIE